MNYRNHVDLEPLVQPMYYANPKSSAAYEVKNQFMFGSELMVAPITQPNNKLTQMGSVNTWLPRGDWFDFFNGHYYTSKDGRMISVHRTIKDYPVFAKAGAIVPMQNSFKFEAGKDLEIIIFPGADNHFTLYEDAGEGSEFEKGEFSKTEMSLQWSTNPVFTVKPAIGDITLLPKTRNYKFILRGFHSDVSVQVLVNGKEIVSQCTYDADTSSTLVEMSADVSSDIKLVIAGTSLITDNGDAVTRITNLLQKAQIHISLKVEIMKIVKDAEKTLHRKLYELNHNCAIGVEYNALIQAITEQLTMDERDAN